MPKNKEVQPKRGVEVHADLYNRVVKQTKIRSLRLLENRFEIKPEALVHSSEEWKKSVDFKIIDVSVKDPGGLYGIVEFSLICKEARRHVLSCRSKYLVHYTVDGGCDVEAGETFIDRVGRIAVYPYFRSTVASLTSEAGITMPPLPVISMAPRSLDSAASLRSESS
jgi:preprotein translocase subunit SecB